MPPSLKNPRRSLEETPRIVKKRRSETRLGSMAERTGPNDSQSGHYISFLPWYIAAYLSATQKAIHALELIKISGPPPSRAPR